MSYLHITTTGQMYECPVTDCDADGAPTSIRNDVFGGPASVRILFCPNGHELMDMGTAPGPVNDPRAR